MVKTGLIGDQFSSKWCQFSTSTTLFNQVIRHNDKVKPKKLSSFTLNKTDLVQFPYKSKTFKTLFRLKIKN